jgi:diguanylate cyclase
MRDFRRQLTLWKAENAVAAQPAYVANWQRIRYLSPMLVVVFGIHALAFALLWASASPNDATLPWLRGLTALHSVMVIVLSCIALLTRHFRDSVPRAWLPWSTGAFALLGMAFAIAAVVLDQWVTPNITPFVLACMVIALLIYMRPGASAALYLLAYVVFFVAIGWTQHQSQYLFSNRLNGLAAAAMGWGLSILLYRNFGTIAQQRTLLEKANADLQSQQDLLKRLARHDGLTGLYNRNTFVELAKQELSRAQRQGSATAIVLFDLDHFKRVNDTWGHPAGDAVLRHVAAITTATVRSTDLVGRLGGEEFIILLPATSKEAARKLAEKVREKLQATPVDWQGTRITATASLGLAGTSAAEKLDFDVLYTEADKALYLAKQRGRNQVI